MTKQEFGTAMAAMQALFNHTLDDAKIDLYWKRFCNEDYELFFLAARRLMDSFRPTSTVPFPLFSHILEQMGIGGDAAARQVLSLVKHVIQAEGYYHSVSFGDKALHQVIRNYGGWMDVCNWTDHDWQINEGRFLENYKAARQCNAEGPEYLPGFFEMDNNARGYEDGIPQVALYDARKHAATGIISCLHIDRAKLGAPIGQGRIEHRTGHGNGEIGKVGDILPGIIGHKTA